MDQCYGLLGIYGRALEIFNVTLNIAQGISFILIIVALIPFKARIVNLSRSSKVLNGLNTISYVFSCVFLILCMTVNVLAALSVYGYDPESVCWAREADSLYRTFYWYLHMMSFAFLLFILPNTLKKHDITVAGMLFFLSLTLAFGVAVCSGINSMDAGSNPHWNLGANTPLLPLLICLAILALRFGLAFVVTLLKQKDTFTKIMIGLLVFHLANLCLYIYLIWIISARSVPAGY